ncbi:MAG: DNA gyrase subunit A, partial [Clostridia bacterium]|nr:DNA gyrase subunit A [Clostridia bacterium]
LAQPFNMRMTLINGHGNFGSSDGDSAAAMRYTEARLDPLAMELLRDLDKDTVDWSLNFDDTRKEPNTLPGRFPNLLVNGASGIAVGLATNIPPHNLGEVIDGTVALIDSPNMTLVNLMKIIKGPDFPTGAYVTGGDELFNAYSTGRGKLTMRAKYHIEGEGDEKKQIVITELPYQVDKSALLLKIRDLKESKKDAQLGLITDIIDESARDGMRAVIKLKKEAKVQNIVKLLMKYTDMQKTFGVNMVAIAGSKPKQMGLIEILKYYIEYQREVVLKRTKYDLNSAKERMHILEGLLIAIKNIDAVVKIIKTSASPTEAKQRLRAKFSLSEKQVQAIMDMRLARLTSLEVNKLVDEINELKALIDKLTAIVNSKKLQMETVKSELLSIKRQFKSDRRTKVLNDLDKTPLPTEESKPESREGIFCLNKDGLMKVVPPKNFSMALTSAVDCTENELSPVVMEFKEGETLYCFTNKGNCFKVNYTMLPDKKWREKGAKLQAISKDAVDGEKVVSVLKSGSDSDMQCELFFYTQRGMVKRSDFSEYNLSKSSFTAIGLKDGDSLLNVEKVVADSTIFFGTEGGMCLYAETTDIPLQGRTAGGVKGMNVDDSDKVINAFQSDGEGEIVVVTEQGIGKRVISATLDVSARYRKGVKMSDAKLGKVLLYSYVKTPYEIGMVDVDGGVHGVYTEDVEIVEDRTKKGKAVVKIKNIKLESATSHYGKLD